MKQPDMFHKCDLNRYACDVDDDAGDNEDDYNINNNPVVPIIAANQKQQAK